MAFPYNYCGPYISDGKFQESVCGTSKPVDKVDACCDIHDCCFFHCHGGSPCNHRCNRAFVSCQRDTGSLVGNAMAGLVQATNYGVKRLRSSSDSEPYTKHYNVEYSDKTYPWDDQDMTDCPAPQLTPWTRRTKAKGWTPQFSIGKAPKGTAMRRDLFGATKRKRKKVPHAPRNVVEARRQWFAVFANKKQRVRLARQRRARYLSSRYKVQRSRLAHFRKSIAARKIQRAFRKNYFRKPKSSSHRYYQKYRRPRFVQPRPYWSHNFKYKIFPRGFWENSYGVPTGPLRRLRHRSGRVHFRRWRKKHGF